MTDFNKEYLNALLNKEKISMNCERERCVGIITRRK